ncbi:hypothetical protein DSL72_000855 [Monilinia vaccinii-corymbosi]|uniref:Uncharacterized protein n=1 Tax=Monilinia vaccinii-corymbosi TaxID=61207 RepID=A0A8A3P2P2_9HELO|nr:hypothetical protein DSL72_000855 [Monilinia vaccinii-corymbosi]
MRRHSGRPSLLKALAQNARLSHLQVQQHLAKQSIGPTEPLATPSVLIEGIDGFVDEAKAVGAADDLLEAAGDFGVVG